MVVPTEGAVLSAKPWGRFEVRLRPAVFVAALSFFCPFGRSCRQMA